MPKLSACLVNVTMLFQSKETVYVGKPEDFSSLQVSDLNAQDCSQSLLSINIPAMQKDQIEIVSFFSIKQQVSSLKFLWMLLLSIRPTFNVQANKQVGERWGEEDGQ